MLKNIIASVVLLLALILGGCDSGVDVSASFDKQQAVKEGAQVYYLGDVVGKVSSLASSVNGSEVVIQLDADAATTIDPNSAIVINRIKPGSPLEIHPSVMPVEGGVQSGHKFTAMNSMFELVAWSVGDAFKSTTQELGNAVDEFSNYLESDDFKKNKAMVEQGVVDMANSASQALKSIEQDLGAAIAEIDVTEEDLARAIEGLGDDLSPLAKEMAKSGTDLMLELERFSQGLENATPEDHARGQRLIESMLIALERLNESADEGVQKSLDSAERAK